MILPRSRSGCAKAQPPNLGTAGLRHRAPHSAVTAQSKRILPAASRIRHAMCPEPGPDVTAGRIPRASAESAARLTQQRRRRHALVNLPPAVMLARNYECGSADSSKQHGGESPRRRRNRHFLACGLYRWALPGGSIWPVAGRSRESSMEWNAQADA